METFVKIVQLLASLSLLVVIHEFGHFIFAKIFKCRVEKFYLFFDYKFSLLKYKGKQTEFGIGWIPFGGYVKISGMVDESMDKEQLKQEPKPWEYRSKPAWQRLFIIIGGVLMNVVLAMVIYIGLSYFYGKQYIKNSDVTYGLTFGKIAQEVGFKNGDKIIAVDGDTVENYGEIQMMVLLSKNRNVEVERNGEKVIVNVSPERLTPMIKEKNSFSLRVPYVVGQIAEGGVAQKYGVMAGDSIVGINGVSANALDDVKSKLLASKDSVMLQLYRKDSLVNLAVVMDSSRLLGVMIANPNYPISIKKYGFLESIPAGVDRGVDEIGNYFKQLRLIFNTETGAYKEVGGFIAMGKIFPAQWSWYSFWTLTALLSIMLAVINILPIPALDGGHLVFIIYEMVTRRPPSQKFMEAAQYVGFILVLGLLVFANGNDILKLFMGN